MKALVVYDTLYGNTEQVARAIAEGIGGEVHNIKETDPANIGGFDILFIGAPTQGGRATQAMRDFLDKVPDTSLKGVKVAVFDTRITKKIVGIFGYAAGRIEKTLKGKGAIVAAAPEGFFVKGSKGPMEDGEIERATGWAKKIAEKS